MTRDEIIRLSEKAGLVDWTLHGRLESKWEALEQFANLVAAAEREECAKLCDGTRYSGYCPPEDGAAPDYYSDAAENCAYAIRARGET
jgi:hypothetical protein